MRIVARYVAMQKYNNNNGRKARVKREWDRKIFHATVVFQGNIRGALDS